jgi:hypothetical protein
MDDLNIPDPQHIAWNTAYAACRINAPREQVWRVLTDFANYNAWNTFTYDVKMPTFAVGEQFSFTVNMASWYQRNQHERIARIDPPQTVAWYYPFHQNPWLNAIRYQILTVEADNVTLYRTWETFTGLIVPVLKATFFRRVQQGFELCAQGLKAHCEARTC